MVIPIPVDGLSLGFARLTGVRGSAHVNSIEHGPFAGRLMARCTLEIFSGQCVRVRVTVFLVIVSRESSRFTVMRIDLGLELDRDETWVNAAGQLRLDAASPICSR